MGALMEVLTSDIVKEIGYGLGMLLAGMFTVISAWKRNVKPFFEKKLIAPTAEIADQVNHGNFRRMQGDVSQLQTDLDSLREEIHEDVTLVREAQAETSGKLDMIVEYTKQGYNIKK